MKRLPVIIAALFLLMPAMLKAQAGIDVSRFQDSINWKRVAKHSKVEFAYIKATEGASITDPMYKYNVKKAREAGLLVGSYHVYSSRTTAYQQFANFKKALGKTKQDLVPVLDIEATHCHKLYMKRVDKLLELMEKEYGAKPMIYTSEKLYKTHFNIKKYKKYHFFIANYKREPAVAYTLWQYTQRGKLKGIAGFVDLSKFNRKYTVENIKIKKKAVEAEPAEKPSQTNQPAKAATAQGQANAKPAAKPASKPAAKPAAK